MMCSPGAGPTGMLSSHHRRRRPPCTLHYVDVGSNKGDSLEDFVSLRPDKHIRLLLDEAQPGWHPRSTCVHGFEPNRRWTKALENVSARLSPMVASLEIFYETALVSEQQKSVSLFGQRQRRLRWCFGCDAPWQHRYDCICSQSCELANQTDLPWPELPVVVRMDVEGAEYSLLRNLAVSGLGRTRQLFVGLEWHRFAKHRVMYGDQTLHLQRLDKFWAHFNRATGVDAKSKEAVSSLLQNYEKVLSLMLGAANITTAEHLIFNFSRAERDAMLM